MALDSSTGFSRKEAQKAQKIGKAYLSLLCFLVAAVLPSAVAQQRDPKSKAIPEVSKSD